MIKKFIEKVISFKKGNMNKDIYILRKRDVFLRDTEEPYLKLKKYSEMINVLRKENKNNLCRYSVEILDYGVIECDKLVDKKIISKQIDNNSNENSFISYSFPLHLKNEECQIKLSAMPSPYSEYTEIGCELLSGKDNKIIFSLSTDLKLKYCDDNLHNVLEDVSYDMIDTYYKEFKDYRMSFKLLKNLLDCSICDYIQYDFIKEEYPA